MKSFFLLLSSTLRKDWQNYISYRFNSLGEFLFSFMVIFFIFYISKIFDRNDSSYLSDFNGNYFLFLLTGASVLLFLSRTISSMPFFINTAQSHGFIDSMLGTKYNLISILLASAAFPLAQAILRIIILFCIAFLFDPQSLKLTLLFEIILILTFSSIPFIGISLFVCGIMIYYKRANFLISLILLGCTIFSGIIFPIEVLPSYLQKLSIMFPSSLSVELIRARVIEGFSYNSFFDEIIYIFILSIVYFVLGIVTFRYFLSKAKKKGTISHY